MHNVAIFSTPDVLDVFMSETWKVLMDFLLLHFIDSLQHKLYNSTWIRYGYRYKTRGSTNTKRSLQKKNSCKWMPRIALARNLHTVLKIANFYSVTKHPSQTRWFGLWSPPPPFSVLSLLPTPCPPWKFFCAAHTALVIKLWQGEKSQTYRHTDKQTDKQTAVCLNCLNTSVRG